MASPARKNRSAGELFPSPGVAVFCVFWMEIRKAVELVGVQRVLGEPYCVLRKAPKREGRKKSRKNRQVMANLVGPFHLVLHALGQFLDLFSLA